MPLSFRQSKPSLRHSGSEHLESHVPSLNLFIHSVLPGHWPHGSTDVAVETKADWVKKKCANCAQCYTLIAVWFQCFIAGPAPPHIKNPHCFRALATIHNNAGQAVRGGSRYKLLKGTGNGADINRKFPREANSNRKWSGPGPWPGLNKGRRSLLW